MDNITLINGLEVWTPTGSTLTDQDSTPPTQMYLSKLSFRNRFSFTEKVAIEEAAVTDSEVRVLVKDQDAAEYIDPTRIDTIQGVALLVNKNLVTVERSSIILSSVIQDHEVYRG